MPGYGKRMERYAPEPTNEVQELDQRFKLPLLPAMTLVQLTILAMILAYAWSVRKMNRAVVSTAMLAIALLHMYDHMYRVSSSSQKRRRRGTVVRAENKLIVSCKKYACQNRS